MQNENNDSARAASVGPLYTAVHHWGHVWAWPIFALESISGPASQSQDMRLGREELDRLKVQGFHTKRRC